MVIILRKVVFVYFVVSNSIKESSEIVVRIDHSSFFRIQIQIECILVVLISRVVLFALLLLLSQLIDIRFILVTDKSGCCLQREFLPMGLYYTLDDFQSLL